MSDERTPAEAPIRQVTLLEDRAQVLRRGRLTLGVGAHRLVVVGVAPVLQDVSLRARALSSAARVTDVRVRRAMRVRRTDRPEERRALEERAADIARRFAEQADERARAERLAASLARSIETSLQELHEDVAWGRADEQAWRDGLEELAAKRKEAHAAQLAAWFAQQDLLREARHVADERVALDRVDHHLEASVELDVLVEESGPLELVVEYTVPNALWRPLHRARLLDGGKLAFEAQAAVWQSTGEDWPDATLVFSTARASLGTEPPLLSDDRLKTTRRSDEVVVEARAVRVQRAKVDAGAAGSPAERAVDLPGVDDGGDVQTLRAERPCTVPADGRPNVVPLFRFEAEAERSLVASPELVEAVLLRARARHEGKAPLLAGPVELVRESGTVGYTRTLFVAPGERFDLGFGPDDGVRVTRRAQEEPIPDPVGHWTITQHTVAVYLSNLGDEEKVVEVSERVPVSELEHVRITIVEDQSDPAPRVDEDGIARWLVALPPHGRSRVKLVWRHALAPGVKELTERGADERV